MEEENRTTVRYVLHETPLLRMGGGKKTLSFDWLRCISPLFKLTATRRIESGRNRFFFLAPLFSFSSPRRKKTISPFLRNFKLSPPEPRKGENGEEGGRKSFSFPSLFYTRDPPIPRKKDRKIEKQFSAFSFGIFYVHLFFCWQTGSSARTPRSTATRSPTWT